MKLSEYIKKISVILDQPDVQEATLDIGVIPYDDDIEVNHESSNRVKFTVSKRKGEVIT